MSASADPALALGSPDDAGCLRTAECGRKQPASSVPVPEATDQVRRSLRLRLARASSYRCGIASAVEVLAWTAADQEDPNRAAILLGAADGLWQDLGMPLATQQHLFDEHDACRRLARVALGEAEFDATVAHGRALPLAAALGYALDERPRHAAGPQGAGTRPLLTPHEHQVAHLVAAGLSNQEIATRLVISRRTAESHVEHILAKLGVTNRAQVATWMAARRDQGDLRDRQEPARCES